MKLLIITVTQSDTVDNCMTGPAYPVARAVATRVHPHFARHAAEPQHPKADLAPLPDVEAIEAIIDAAFWASLRREEGYVPKISLAFIPPDRAGRPLTFGRPLPLTSSALTRLAPAVERPGIHLGVWREQEELVVWGATRALPRFCFVLEVVAPGLLVVKHRRGEESGKFTNVAVLEGDRIKVLDQQAASMPDCPDVLMSLLGLDTPADAGDSVNVLIQLGASMRAHGRGGSLLVVPANTEGWKESIVQPVAYSVLPPFSGLADLVRSGPGAKGQRRWEEALRLAVEAIAGLTAVDGATVITDQHDLLAFGAKIARRKGHSPVEQVVLTEPVEGAMPDVIHPSQLGGTRHLSAAQFTQDQQDSIALVASQDGRFTVFAWAACQKMVRAHRVESLLL
jgi:hypothetical protein